MAKINGTNLAASVVPFTTEDTFATHHAKYGQGGWQEVATIADRDAITTARREAGMAVYVTSESKLYTLNEDLETWSIFETGKIDTISVNGEAQPIEDKNVDITVPTKTSDIENDGDGESPFATEDYVDEFGGKIDTIKVNGVEQEIVDKTVDIAVPTKTSDIDNDSDFQNSTQVQTAIVENIVNNTTSTDTDKSLSAAAGKSLQDQVNNLLGRGKYLSVWDCTTGLAMDEPPVNPYTVETGSYFIVGKIASAGGTNYRPNGGIYDKDVPSTTIETGEVKVNDTYFYDGTVWRLLDVPEKDVAFSSLAGSPRDNDALKAEFEGIEADIDEKADKDSLQAHIDDKDNPHEVTKAQVGLGNVDNTSDLNKPISTATQNALNTKQDTLTAGDNIVIEDNVISATIKESTYTAGENITISPIGYIGAGYKPLLYAQGDGEHYIDTGRPYTDNSVITMYAKGYKIFEGSASECLAGSSNASTTESSVGFIANSDKCVGGQLGNRVYSNISDLEMEEIKLNIPEGKIYFNGANPITHATTPTNLNAYLFAYNRDGEAYKVSEGRIQRYTQVDNGVVVLDYVACIRTLDNAIGFFDKVSHRFVTCEGLTAGPDISNRFEISATDTTYTAGDNITISENNVISATDTTYTAGDGIEISEDNEISSKVYSEESNIIYGTDFQSRQTTYKAGDGLEIEYYKVPDDMTAKDYVQLSSTSYYSPSFAIYSSFNNVHTTVVVDVVDTPDTSKTYCVFGCIGSSGSYAFTIEGGKYWVYYGSVVGVNTGVSPTVGAGKPDKLEFIDNKAFINDKLVATFTEGGISTGPWWFGNINGSWGVTKTSFQNRLLSLKLEYNGAVRNHLIPVAYTRSGSEVIGFYDVMMAGTYAPSTGTSTAGNDAVYHSLLKTIPYKAGNNVTIEDNIISASGKEYVAGDGIIIDDNEISVDPTIKGNRLAQGDGTVLKKDLPYIIADKGQYTSLGGSSAGNSYIYCRFKLLELPTNLGGIFGGGSGNNCSMLYVEKVNGVSQFKYKYADTITTLGPADTEWHELVNLNRMVIFDGVLKGNAGSGSGNLGISLHGASINGSFYTTKSEIALFKYAYGVTEGEFIWYNYYPTQRSSDGQIGYYCPESKKWFFSNTADSFTTDYVGEYEINIDEDVVQRKLVAGDNITINDNLLPIGYVEVEGVGGKDIDTGITIDPNINYVIEFDLYSAQGNNNKPLFGAKGPNNSMRLYTDASGNIYYGYANNSSTEQSVLVGTMSIGSYQHVVLTLNNSCKIGNQTTNIIGKTASTDRSIYLCGTNGISYTGAYNIKTVKIKTYSGYGSIFYGIPCVRTSDNMSGLYDVVSQRFIPTYQVTSYKPVATISATTKEYTAGTGINISNNQISAVKGEWEWKGSANNTIALGNSSYARGSADVVIGQDAQTYGGSFSVVIGRSATANGTNNTIIGYNSHASIGSSITYSACTVIGSTNKVYGGYNTIVGYNSNAGDVASSPQYSLVMGVSAKVTTSQSVAIGYGTEVVADYGIAIGNGSRTSGSEGIAIGNGARASASASVQLGNGTNSTFGTLKFRSYRLLDANGYIPADRLAGVGKQYEGRVLTLDDNSDPAWLEVNGLPEQTGHSGQYLTTNGTTASWANVAVYTAGDGIDITNNVLSAKTDNTTIGFDANGNLKVLEREPDYDPEEEMLIFDWGTDNPKYIEDEEEIVF